MSSSMPELGSKISLISKADIRYEGRLFTVDPQECTIALSNVRSFGTEDRDTQYQIAPQSQIYDYILFRGSDIKDIRVVNSSLPHPNDPAIMQVQLPSGQHLMPHFPITNINSSHTGIGNGFTNPFGPMGGLGNIGNGVNTSGTNAASLAPVTSSGTTGSFLLGQPTQQQVIQQKHQSAQQQQKQQISVIDMIAGGSRSTTPMSLISRKSPSADMNTQPMQIQTNQQSHNVVNPAHVGNIRDGVSKRPNQIQRVNRSEYYQQQHQTVLRGVDGRIENYNYSDGRINYNNQRSHPNHNRNWTMHRGGNMNMNTNINIRNRGTAAGRSKIQNQGFRQMGTLNNQIKPRGKNTIKFEQDFDFEQANNKFEELRSQLSKLKVGDDSKNDQVNTETDKKDDSGNETGAGEHEPEEEEITVGYDKTKSFFDNISCEAAQDRSKNKKNDWRQERKLNSETFGVSSTRRGNYRTRPNFYNNRNANNYIGGFNRGYRSGNFRNRSNNRNNHLNREINHSINGTNNNLTPNNPKNHIQQTTGHIDSIMPNIPATSKGTLIKETLISSQNTPVGHGIQL